jgi:SAM-dependent methyltransferase
LERTNEVLLDQLPVGDLLDVGFGEGGFSVAAATRGFRVTAVTLCAEHVHLARTLASTRHVANRCQFLIADMNALPFATESFDAIVNEETWCYAPSKVAYLQSVRQLLRPGGVFRAVDLAIADEPHSPRVSRDHRTVQAGFRLASLISPEQTQEDLRNTGFEEISVVDITRKVRRAALLILAFSAGPYLLTTLKIDRVLYGSEPRLAGHYRGHVAACMAFNRGLFNGTFHYLYVTARRPAVNAVRS